MVQANFTVTPLSGNVYSTEFIVKNTTPGNFNKYVWDFGNGNLVYDIDSPTHFYNTAGTHTITLTAIDIEGNLTTHSVTVSTEFIYRDFIRFVDIPEEFADPGKPTQTPFKIEVFSSQIDVPLKVDLYASNSQSIPSQFVYPRWEFLNPTWKFLDTNFNFVETLEISSTPLIRNNKVVGLSSVGEFYYVDDLSNGDLTVNKPILVTATLQTSGYVNPKDSNITNFDSYSNNETVRAGLIWHVNDLFPTQLKVTSNYLDNIPPQNWQTIKIPTLVTCHCNRSRLIPGSKDELSEIIFSYPQSNETGSLQPLTLTLSGLPLNTYLVEDAPLYFKKYTNDFRTGGYIFTTVTSNVTSNKTAVVAQTTAFNLFPSDRLDKFVYPVGRAPNIFAWVSNPAHNTLNKITVIPYQYNCPTIEYYIDKKVLVDGIVKETLVPYNSSNSTYNYNLSGNSGIYSLAIDPRRYELIAADAETDKLYKFSTNGELLSVFDFFTFDIKNSLITTNWELSTLVYTDKSYIVINLFTGGLSQIADLFISTEEDFIFILDNQQRSIYKYRITVPGDLNSIQYVNESYFIGNIPGIPKGIHFNKTGTIMSVLIDNFIFNFNLSEPWSLASNNVSNFEVVSLENLSNFTPEGFTFSLDGLKCYIVGTGTEKGIYIFELLTPSIFNVANIQNLPGQYIPFAYNNVVDVAITPYNEKVFILDKDEQNIYEYTFNEQNILEETNVSYNLENTSINAVGITTSSKKFNLFSINESSVINEYVFEYVYHGTGNTPSNISLDKDYNIWVSLFNSVSVVKIDKDFNFLFSTIPNGFTPDMIYDGDYLLKPPVVETDSESNCWAAYSHPLCSLLVKYDSYGNVLNQIELDLYSVPVGLAINAQNNVWVANSYNVISNYGTLTLHDSSDLSIIDTVPNVFRPSYVTIDRDNNLWFTFGERRLGYYNTTTKFLTGWSLDTNDESDNPFQGQSFVVLEETRKDETIGGLAVDVFNRVWLVDSLNNNVWILSGTPEFNEQPIKKIKIRPNTPIGYFQDINNFTTYTAPSSQFTAQAAGDWTGNRWYQKYCTQSVLSSIAISGTSTEFDITPFTNNYQINLFNDSFNMSEYLQSLALSEHFFNNFNLFKTFLGQAVGDGSDNNYEDIGQVIYSKIANYINNHADIDTCNIDQLLSYAEQTRTPYLDYSTVLPVDIRNMLNIASVSKNKLQGIPDNVPLLQQSLGPVLNTETAIVSAGQKIVLRNKQTAKFTVFILPVNNNQFVYPLSSFNSVVFDQPVFEKYQIFTFNPKYLDRYLDGLINWYSPLTTLSPTMSTHEEWYGENGILENNFKYLLTKNLFTK